ncbi:RWP-RK domain-containing protein [Galdieria sulphuraria]|uniref:RWP-RK domain-containing protein n=1 Tax=Galdieria sulphuraria TaxID=130081 RepID=M2X095_GALSU|nr:RWP-RK domain-containing protein [Galdieria sulphuraria]EME29750.1 RWP-RK domain-containing protein [Galdieria sulphuraria]|eukprot:XP_005706270.1 RWP-RK domain-containing protein [Galdieria sulphuraria]
MKKEKGGSSYERRDKFFTFDLYERTVSVLCKLDSKNCHNRIEDFFVYIEVSATKASKPVFFASCVVFENDYRHEPVLFHVEVPFLTSTESLPLVIGIFRAIMDSTVGHHGSWIYKNERCLFHAYESIIDERMKSDKEELTTPNKDHFVSQKDLLDSYKDVREKLAQVRKRIIGKSKRTVFYTIFKEDLIDFFVRPRDEVAQELGICVTLLKKICRKNGIKQWPYRKLKNVDAKLSSLRRLLSTPDLIPKNRKKFLEDYDLLLTERERILHGHE